MQVFITKYAFSGGTKACEVITDHDDGRVTVQWPGGMRSGVTFHPGEWARTIEEVADQVEVMRTRKIASLKRQIEKLEVLDPSKVRS